MINTDPIFKSQLYELTLFTKENKSRLGIVSINGSGIYSQKKLIGDIAAETIKNKESFFKKLSIFLCLKQKDGYSFQIQMS